MENDNILELLLKSEFSEVSKLTKKMEMQIGKLHEKNPVMALIFLTNISNYAEGYIDSVLKNNNIPQESWNEILAKVGEWDLEEFLSTAKTITIPELKNEGWGFLPEINPNKQAHYFTKERRSLCEKYVYFPDDNGNEEPLEDENGTKSSDDCPVCRELLGELKMFKQMASIE